MEQSAEVVKKTLISALENLESKACTLEDLSNFSCSVLDKFKHPRPRPTGEEVGCAKEMINETEPDLIDLFNKVAERIERATRVIGENTENIRCIIE